jgi:hypothetical protein
MTNASVGIALHHHRDFGSYLPTSQPVDVHVGRSNLLVVITRVSYLVVLTYGIVAGTLVLGHPRKPGPLLDSTHTLVYGRLTGTILVQLNLGGGRCPERATTAICSRPRRPFDLAPSGPGSGQTRGCLTSYGAQSIPYLARI